MIEADAGRKVVEPRIGAVEGRQKGFREGQNRVRYLLFSACCAELNFGWTADVAEDRRSLNWRQDTGTFRARTPFNCLVRRRAVRA